MRSFQVVDNATPNVGLLMSVHTVITGGSFEVFEGAKKSLLVSAFLSEKSTKRDVST